MALLEASGYRTSGGFRDYCAACAGAHSPGIVHKHYAAWAMVRRRAGDDYIIC